MNFLKNVDIFGVPFVQSINQQQTVFKSALGGFLSLIICTASLAYGFWVFYLWNSNQMSPKISNSRYVSDYQSLDYNSGKITLYYEAYEGLIDPFKSKILLPLVMYTDYYDPTEPMIIENYTESTFGNLYIPKLDFGFSYADGYLQTSKQMYIFIAQCQEKYLKPDEKCASSELKEQFFKQQFNYFGLQIYSTALDSRDGSEQMTVQDIYIEIEQQSCYNINTFLETNKYEVEDYLLFGTSKITEYISGAQVQTQTLSAERCKLTHKNEILAAIYITMNGTQTKTIFQYPHLGDLLANIGSIISILFMMKYIIIYLNQHSLNQKVITELINFYYPEFQNIKIIKNWRQQIIKISLNQIEVDKKAYLKLYDKVQKQMRQKLSYMNLLYEISRLYLLIRSFKFREEILKSHSIGIKLHLPFVTEDGFSNFKSTQRFNIKREPFILNEDDAELLSIERKGIQKEIITIPDEIQDEEDYYNLNKFF
ncbi:unnamed protein product [Paramecium primaurelia]|uniref:Transmembrane protein n=1 Tax=Paramecium primaurelia TaxID=5886 RepID=A0A8S1PX48_PARPR|nr:unnamed protein product [Paramecium primaurelia]